MAKQVSSTIQGRTIRDCIHNDIALTPLECAIVDTRIFQRLRYIRQNGLLHFVFPGAVHTRFAHSLGTMAIAAGVEAQIFRELRSSAKNNDQRRAIEYLGAVFRAAALLHDVGHCAFSHSIEDIEFNEKPLLGTLGGFCRAWKAEALLERLIGAHAGENLGHDTAVAHEHISLVLVGRIFEDARVAEACAMSSADLAEDVQMVIDGRLAPSKTWREQVERLRPIVRDVHGDCVGSLSGNLGKILHRLVSGTLDVDRLDYLKRDAVHCGVPYGRCDTNMLVSSLGIGEVGGEVDLLLHRKAAHALDDMLWSRYQMFIQVYNHKTNCGFNAVLGKALGQALEQKEIDEPNTAESLIYFTDDYVMGSLARACRHGNQSLSAFARVLIHRTPPRHVAYRVVTPGDDPREATAALAAEHNVDVDGDEILAHTARSQFVKADGLPTLVHQERGTSRRLLTNFEDVSSVTSDKNFQPTEYRVVHLFRDATGAGHT